MKLFGNDHGIYLSYFDKDRFYMDFNPTDPKYSKELIQHCFEKEEKYLKRVSEYAWAPEEIIINSNERKISFKFYGETCETRLPNTYIEQLEEIVRDLHKLEIYKPSFYPKYFYTDPTGKIHAFNFYTCSVYKEQPISIDFYKPILNEDRLKLVEELSVNGKLDMSLLLKYAFNNYIKWPQNPLPKIYKKVYE